VAAIGTGNPTLLDQIKRTDPDGSIANIVEALTERNPILMDATAMEGNLPTGHRVTIRDGLPAVGWRMLNQGITSSKSTTIQVDESCGLLEGRSVVDCELAKLNGNEAAFRASEDRSFLQALNNEAASAIFFASTKTDPEKILGFAPRYKALTADTNSSHVIDSAAGTGTGVDMSSIWFITWGPDTAYLIYPKGSQAGITSEDLGKEYEDEGGATPPRKYLAWRTHWCWRLGLCVKDWRYHVRIANIDSDTASSETELIDAMIEGYNKIYDMNSGRTVCYMNRTVKTFVDKIMFNKSNMYFTPVEWHGRNITGFRGIPIVTCDALAQTESAVA